MTDRIGTAEAAARLGVKRETLYAYVSRGVLGSEPATTGRGSTFDPKEIDRLRRRRHERRPGRLEVPVSSAVTDVRDGHVAYRGRPLPDLVASAFSFESVAELLWTGIWDETPGWPPSERVHTAVRAASVALADHAQPIHRMMAGVVAAAAADPFRDDRSPHGVAAVGRSLLGAIVAALPLRADAWDQALASRLWAGLTPEAPDSWPLVDLALTVLADHGMATSTLAGRLAASTRAGPHAVLLAALGTVAGPLHGAASRRVHRLFAEASTGGVDAAIAEVVRRDGKVPGVGHLIHRTADPRHDLLADAVTSGDVDPDRIAVALAVRDRVAAHVGAAPNVDFALGTLTWAAGMSEEAGELIFALARTAGWLAHALEEYGEAPLRFRPVGRYRPGPPHGTP